MFSSNCNFIHIGRRYNLLSITGIFHFNQSLGIKRENCKISLMKSLNVFEIHMEVIFTNCSMEAEHPMTFYFPIRFCDAQKICITVFIRHWKISDPENSAIHFLKKYWKKSCFHMFCGPQKKTIILY